MNFKLYSQYYDLFYGDKDYSAETDFLQSLLERLSFRGESVLDLGCGTGGHAFPLAKVGYRVTGVDLSEAMLKRASEKAAALAGPRPKFLPGDARSVRLGSEFDLVVSLFHVMSYQTTNEDLISAFRTARAHLKPGGVFIFDAWYGPAVLSERPSTRVKRGQTAAIEALRIAEPTLRSEENVVDVNYEIMITEKSTGAVNVFKETHRMRYLFLPELKSMLGEAGFQLLSSGEWMTGRPLGTNTWNAYFIAGG